MGDFKNLFNKEEVLILVGGALRISWKHLRNFVVPTKGATAATLLAGAEDGWVESSRQRSSAAAIGESEPIFYGQITKWQDTRRR